MAALAPDGFRICGHYCGPQWCNDQNQPEQGACFLSETLLEATSCTDDCCRLHDLCCDGTDRSPCNKDIISCIAFCTGGGGEEEMCKTKDDLPVPGQVVAMGMQLVENWCCSEPCANQTAQGLPFR